MASQPRVAAAVMLGCFLLSGCTLTRPNPKAVEAQVALSVPVNSSSAEVFDYLDRQKLPHSRFHHDETFGDVIETELSIPSPRALVYPSYDVFFIFDIHDRLVKYNVGFLGFIGL